MFDFPTTRQLPYWEYVIQSGEGQLDHLLLPRRDGFEIISPVASAPAAPAPLGEQLPYASSADFTAQRSTAAADPEDNDERADKARARNRERETRFEVTVGDRFQPFLGEGLSDSLVNDSTSLQAPAIVDLNGDGRDDDGDALMGDDDPGSQRFEGHAEEDDPAMSSPIKKKTRMSKSENKERKDKKKKDKEQSRKDKCARETSPTKTTGGNDGTTVASPSVLKTPKYSNPATNNKGKTKSKEVRITADDYIHKHQRIFIDAKITLKSPMEEDDRLADEFVDAIKSIITNARLVDPNVVLDCKSAGEYPFLSKALQVPHPTIQNLIVTSPMAQKQNSSAANLGRMVVAQMMMGK